MSAQFTFDWAKGFGGDREDKATSVIETFDGGLLLGGVVIQKKTHLWLLKLDENGQEVWGKTYENNFSSGANSIIETTDSCIVAVGFITKKKNDRTTDGWFLKTNYKGKILFEKQFGKSGNEELKDIVQIPDGGYVAVGFSDSNSDDEKEIWIIKIDAQANLLWSKTYGDTEEDAANSVCLTSDGACVIAGYATRRDKHVLRLIKIDADGNDIWDKPFDTGALREADDVVETGNGSLVVVGYNSWTNSKQSDALVEILDASGDSLYTLIYPVDGRAEATSVCTTHDSMVVVTGYSESNQLMKSNFWLKKINIKGEIVWQSDFLRKSYDYPSSVTETRDNGLISVGATYNLEQGWDYAALKYRTNNKTRIVFSSPYDTISASGVKDFELDICFTGDNSIQNVDVTVNGSLQFSGQPSKNLITTKECPCPFIEIVHLQPGMNKVKISARDNRNYFVSEERIIYYIPPPNITW
jgi:hypothetical protein